MSRATVAVLRLTANADPAARQPTRPSKPPADRPQDRSIDPPPNPLRDELQGVTMPQHDKPGRKPIGQRALTAAERQARYRARHTGTVVIRYRRHADRRSRPQRW